MMLNAEGTGDDDLGADFEKEFAKEIKKLGRFNLAIFGKTGVGKSTLINTVFREQVATTGNTRNVTTDTTYYEKEGVPLGIYDTEGWTMGETGERALKGFRSLCEDLKDKPINEQVHVIWYCVRAGDRRFEDAQAEFVQELCSVGIPVLLVLTQVPTNNQGEYHPEALVLAEDIKSRGLPTYPSGRVHLTMAAEDTFKGEPAHGLEALVEDTLQAAPDGVKKAFISAQQIDIKSKIREARLVTTGAGALALAAGATPIPFSDAALLVPIQVAMMARIAAVFGLSARPRQLALLVGEVFAANAVTQAGKYLVTNLLKFVPGANIAAMAIQGAVAAALTKGVGEAWIVVCRQIHQQEAALEDLPLDELKKLFIDAFKRWNED